MLEKGDSLCYNLKAVYIGRELQGLAGIAQGILLWNHRSSIDWELMRQKFTNKNEEVKIMREGIHPEYYQATVTCNCGNTFVTGSTKKDIHVEICSKCHSFYTGQQKAAAARGRIDKFNRKYGINK